MNSSLNIFLDKKILIYGLGKSGLATFNFLKEKSEVFLYDDYLKNFKNLTSYKNLKKIEFDLYDYVTNKTIDGIFILMSEYEKNIRQNSNSSKSNTIINFFN